MKTRLLSDRHAVFRMFHICGFDVVFSISLKALRRVAKWGTSVPRQKRPGRSGLPGFALLTYHKTLSRCLCFFHPEYPNQTGLRPSFFLRFGNGVSRSHFLRWQAEAVWERRGGAEHSYIGERRAKAAEKGGARARAIEIINIDRSCMPVHPSLINSSHFKVHGSADGTPIS